MPAFTHIIWKYKKQLKTLKTKSYETENYDSDDSLFVVGANVCQCICRSIRTLWRFNNMDTRRFRQPHVVRKWRNVELWL